MNKKEKAKTDKFFDNFFLKAWPTLDEATKNQVSALVIAVKNRHSLTPQQRREFDRAFAADEKAGNAQTVKAWLIRHRYLTRAGEMGRRTVAALHRPG